MALQRTEASGGPAGGARRQVWGEVRGIECGTEAWPWGQKTETAALPPTRANPGSGELEGQTQSAWWRASGWGREMRPQGTREFGGSDSCASCLWWESPNYLALSKFKAEH